jgi:hypothetical protein
MRVKKIKTVNDVKVRSLRDEIVAAIESGKGLNELVELFPGVGITELDDLVVNIRG